LPVSSTPPPPNQPNQPAPGWYPDPGTPGQQRYWDGTAWTGHVAPLQAAGTTAPGAGGTGIDTWLWQSIVVTLMCCLPLGVAGIVNASQASTEIANGNLAEAQRKADLAKKFSLFGVGAFFVLGIGWLMLMFLGIAAAEF
jgi:hypothetical protein